MNSCPPIIVVLAPPRLPGAGKAGVCGWLPLGHLTASESSPLSQHTPRCISRPISLLVLIWFVHAGSE